MTEQTNQKKSGFYDSIAQPLRPGVRLSIIEGSLSTVMGTFTGGAFLIGYALVLGADDFEIGLLSSLPLLANLIQIIGSLIIAKAGSRKKVCALYLFLHRMTWTCIALLPLIVFHDRLADARIWIFLFLLTAASVCASITGIAWTAWIADLIPKGVRGRFFSRRNMFAQVVGMIAAVGAGQFIDIWQSRHTTARMQSNGFMILFTIGIVFGLASIILIRKMHEPAIAPSQDTAFFKQLREPFQDKNFRIFIIFSMAWGFSTGIVGPFFSVYMINTLQIPFSMITLFGVAAGLASIAGFKLWGAMIDKVGARPLALLCGIGGSFVPFFWIFATPDQYLMIWISNIVSGLFFAGIGLASTGLMMNLAPERNNAVYFAVFAAVTGLSGALAPVAGGALGDFFRGRTLYEGFVIFSDIRLLFLASTLMRLLSLLIIRFIKTSETVSVTQMFGRISKLQAYLPLYQIQTITTTGLSAAENIMNGMAKGVISVEAKIDHLLDRGFDLSKAVIFKARLLDQHLDDGLAQHEARLEKLIDRIIALFKRKG
ncbi:MAG: MFS transporter [Ruminococcaceae bacterium]|nr:MFS transporter [Oscillospiraceae bacterium]